VSCIVELEVDCKVEVDYLKGREYLDSGDALSRLGQSS